MFKTHPTDSIDLAPYSSGDLSFHQFRQRILSRSVVPITYWLAGLYLAYSLLYLFLLPEALRQYLFPMTLATSLFFLGMGLVLQARSGFIQAMDGLVNLLAGVAWINPVFTLLLTFEPRQSTDLALFIIAIGFFFYSLRSLLVFIVLSLVVWTACAWQAGLDEAWLHFGLMMALSTFIAVLMYSIRTRFHYTYFENLLRLSESQENLHQSEQRLQQFLDQAHDLIQSLDEQGRFVYVNESWRRLLGYSDQDLQTLTIFDIVAPENLEAFQKLFNDVKQSGSLTQFEVEVITKAGNRLILEGNANCRYEDGRLAAIEGIFRDVTSIKQAKEQLETAMVRAETASQAKSEFLANISHELRTPLNAIIGFAKILARNNDENLHQQQLLYLNRIEENGIHLLTMIDNVLDLAKIEAGRLDLHVETVQLRDFLQDFYRRYEGLAQENQVALRLECPEFVAEIETDAGKLTQILNNLVGNAIKFSKNGQVDIRLLAHPATEEPTAIEVIDSGIGIPQDKLNIIFDAFSQAESSTSRRFGGSGLGLTITQSLCHRLGYRIEVESVVDQGSTFRILL